MLYPEQQSPEYPPTYISTLLSMIGGSFDTYTTNTIGNVVRDTFTPKELATA